MSHNLSLPHTEVGIVAPDAFPLLESWISCFRGAKSVTVFPSFANAKGSSSDLLVVLDPEDLDHENLEMLKDLCNTSTHILLANVVGTRYPESLFQLSGIRTCLPLQTGEWFIKPLIHTFNLEEFHLNGSIADLTPDDETTVTLACVSVGFHDRITAVRRENLTTLAIKPETARDFSVSFVRFLHRILFEPIPGSAFPVKVGIIGYGPFGGMGHFHGAGCRSTPLLNFVAIGEHNDIRRASARAEFPNIRTHHTALQLIDDSGVDLVIIATPPDTHYSLAKTALESGKHVVLEKPMCLTVEQADHLTALASSQNKVLTVHQNRRFDGDYLALLELINSGDLGEVFNIETFVGSFEHPCRAWHSDIAISGGAAYDWGSHHIDWIIQILKDRPQEIFVNVHKRVWNDVTNADQIRIRMSFEDGREAEFIQSDVAAIRKPKFYVQGTKGTVVGMYEPISNTKIEFPFGYQLTNYHHAEAPVSLTLTTYNGPLGSRTSVISPITVKPFEFHQNLANHLVFGEPLAITPESVRPVIEILEVSQSLSQSNEHYAKL